MPFLCLLAFAGECAVAATLLGRTGSHGTLHNWRMRCGSRNFHDHQWRLLPEPWYRCLGWLSPLESHTALGLAMSNAPAACSPISTPSLFIAAYLGNLMAPSDKSNTAPVRNCSAPSLSAELLSSCSTPAQASPAAPARLVPQRIRSTPASSTEAYLVPMTSKPWADHRHCLGASERSRKIARIHIRPHAARRPGGRGTLHTRKITG